MSRVLVGRFPALTRRVPDSPMQALLMRHMSEMQLLSIERPAVVEALAEQSHRFASALRALANADAELDESATDAASQQKATASVPVGNHPTG